MLKTSWVHSSNRYAWVTLYEAGSAAMDYYTPDTIQLGHAISYLRSKTDFI